MSNVFDNDSAFSKWDHRYCLSCNGKGHGNGHCKHHHGPSPVPEPTTYGLIFIIIALAIYFCNKKPRK